MFMAALAVISVMMASSASAQPDPMKAPAVGVGRPTPTPPAASTDAAMGAANAASKGDAADITVPPTHRETLNDCMGYWDAETHMSKTEWREACRRTLNGTDMGGLDLLTPEYTPTGGQKGRRAVGGSRP
jgi:hypothetical protein